MRPALVLLVAVALSGCVPHIRDLPVDPAAWTEIRTKPVIAVHYEERLLGADYDQRRPQPTPVFHVSAPTVRIKRRFLDLVAGPAGFGRVRDIPEGRFAYLGRTTFGRSRIFAPDIARLKRTFGTGLVLEVYSPLAFATRGDVALRVVGRLVRLDDAAVRWVRDCEFVGRYDPAAYAMKNPPIEDFLGQALVAEADRCAADLAQHFMATRR